MADPFYLDGASNHDMLKFLEENPGAGSLPPEELADLYHKWAVSYSERVTGVPYSEASAEQVLGQVNGTMPGSSAQDNMSVNDVNYNMFRETGDTSWFEKYLDNLVERENVSSARDWEQYMADTQYQRGVADLKAAGLNPWLAVQNSSAGVPSVAAAASTGVSSSSQQVSKQNAKTQANSELLGRIVTTLGLGLTMLIRAVTK